MARHYKLLSINGGGVRGLVPAKIIEKITTIAGKPIDQLFDYVVGTSAGGIIAISLTVQDKDGNAKYSASEIVQLFREEAQQIFPPHYLDNIPFLRTVGQLFAAKHSRVGIDKLLDLKLGNATFLNTTMPVTTVSYSLDSDGPRLWSRYRAENDPDYHNYYLKDAAGATSAAPTFFPPKITKALNGELFHDIDGGIFANSPTMIGVSEFLNHQGTRLYNDKITVISIGTGSFKGEPTPPKEDSAFTNLLDRIPAGLFTTLGISTCTVLYFTPVLGLTLGGTCLTTLKIGIAVDIIKAIYNDYGGISWIANGGLVDKMMKGAEISDAFQSKIVDVIRVNPSFDSEYSSMDNSNPRHIQRFEKAIDNFVKKHQTMLQEIVNCLVSEDGDKECDNARSHTAQFGEDFYVELTGRVDKIDF